MSSRTTSALGRLAARIFPQMPDFFALLHDQSQLAVASTEALLAFMQTGETEHSDRVLTLEREGDVLKDRNGDILNQSFATPIDREKIFRAIVTIDEVLNYAKTTIREMQVLAVDPDQHTTFLAVQLRDGAIALDKGYAVLKASPAEAQTLAQAARKAERNCEKIYRRALAELFDVEHEVAALQEMTGPTGPQALARVMQVFKKREVYRHLSNAGDTVAHAGEALRDIVVTII